MESLIFTRRGFHFPDIRLLQVVFKNLQPEVPQAANHPLSTMAPHDTVTLQINITSSLNPGKNGPALNMTSYMTQL